MSRPAARIRFSAVLRRGTAPSRAGAVEGTEADISRGVQARCTPVFQAQAGALTEVRAWLQQWCRRWRLDGLRLPASWWDGCSGELPSAVCRARRTSSRE